jgi:SNF2 family DNA or RNA helicase
MSFRSREFVQNLLRLYPKLSERSKALLRLKALLYFKVPVETWRECFYGLTYLFPTKLSLSIKDFTVLVNELKDKKFLDSAGVLPQALNHALTLEALNSEQAQQYLQALEKALARLGYRFYSHDYFKEEKVNRFRLSIYTLEKGAYDAYAQKYSASEIKDRLKSFFYGETLEIAWLQTRFLEVQREIFAFQLSAFCSTGLYEDQAKSLLDHYLPLRGTEAYRSFEPVFLPYDLLSGETKRISQTLATAVGPAAMLEHERFAFNGMVSFLEGNNDQALCEFDRALKNIRQAVNKKDQLLGKNETIVYLLALLKTNNRKNDSKIQTLLNLANKNSYQHPNIFTNFEKVLLKWQGIEQRGVSYYEKFYDSWDPFASAIGTLLTFWFDDKKVDQKKCRGMFQQYQDFLPLVAKIFAEILLKIDPVHQEEYEQYVSQERFKGLIRFTECVQMGEDWERVLNNLGHFFDRQGLSPAQALKRLAWFFDPNRKSVEVLEQVWQTKGGWSKGKAIALRRLFDHDPKLDYLTEEDRQVIKTLRFERGGWYDNDSYDWDPLKTPLALVGHPCVYHTQNPESRLDLVLGSLALIIKQPNAGFFHLALSHAAYEAVLFVEQETPSRYRLVEFPATLLPLMDVLGLSGIRVPAQAKDHLVSLIQKAGPVLSIHAEGEGLDDTPAQKGDSTPCLRMTPLKGGLKISLWVRPFGDRGPYCRPGRERESLFLFSEGKSLKVNRYFEEELARAETLIKACPTLHRSQDGSDEWQVEDPEPCLEILSELQTLTEEINENLKAEESTKGTKKNRKKTKESPEDTKEFSLNDRRFRVEWPEGQKFSVTPSSSFQNLSLKITKDRDWLSIQGSFKGDEETVLGFEKLLDLLDQSKGRFLPLEGNRFLALSAHFKKQLQELKAISHEKGSGSDKSYHLHPLGGLALQRFADQASKVEGDSQWKQALKAFKKAEEELPQLPSTLQADLRDYQKEGFEWMSRLTSLGMGVCLADDMGLGKTLQALAVLLKEAPKGPCLVVAPTSVCHNWIAEMGKFTPTLVPHTFDQPNRERLVQSLQTMDVLVCSYTLLQQEEAILSNKTWQMIVLDEAQSIKNAGTKRFQAAIKLQGAIKVALTGTPVENHLEEIWSLFRFLAPGLLGSREEFQKRFLSSGEKDKDKVKMMGLKKWVQLFVLRRTKNAVLQELPPRTEQTILVERSLEEESFYEALRRQALVNLSHLSDDQNQGQRKIHILAEITRLRRACCHPRLVDKDLTIGSSKMKVFLELVDDLLDNNHQALVFSQYVGYLTFVREALDQKGIAYQYLDGSTPSQERKRQVEAFQSGKSSLFLLSLKAGGTGLNLTAADYVIHLDPWWNPAVEDQASDRAHRMGQQRPVTIYRLIVQQSIEEKISALHKEKRDLADEILEGSHTPTKMTEEDLLALLSSG